MNLGLDYSAASQAAVLCGGVWVHTEYRELRDRYEQVLHDLAEANAKLASFPLPQPITHSSSRRNMSHHNALNQANGLQQHQGSGSTSIGNSITGGYTTNLASPPDAEILESYRDQISSWQRPVYTSDQLFMVHNYGKEHAKSTKLQQELVDESGMTPDDAEWKLICKDRKVIAGDLLDKERTWTAQRDDIVDVCVSWLERKHPRMALCDESRWKAVNILKARFEEARKPVTAGTRVRKRAADDEGDQILMGIEDEVDKNNVLDPALMNDKADKPVAAKKRKELDIPV